MRNQHLECVAALASSMTALLNKCLHTGTQLAHGEMLLLVIPKGKSDPPRRHRGEAAGPGCDQNSLGGHPVNRLSFSLRINKKKKTKRLN